MHYVSHSLEEVSRLADHMLYVENGQLRAAGPRNQLLTRADLPLAHLDEAETALEGVLDAHDEIFRLSRVCVPGGWLFLPLSELPLGQRVRVSIKARDVSLALENRNAAASLICYKAKS
ncbi:MULTISPECIES: hypothetical protein [unclassified Pseudomonas]|uniref:hypothetical protein n=1 Tax=unclassified Pseudomonas TaxID=196821 RepID=UPI002AC97334|nr:MULTISPECIES: hypothetical protein [unclassified Pseudomonas]MEB0039884.1 hypothetical protein [Pseudomonas sp. MH10]MEB0077175.1 hypothetical protein [Pseudomonas sp. MH10out]MEB0093027.1 hypothetical protein [Pseudomonas sp. CCI4.2]MEB0101522.1 hypothetical protein [Pseudomonas sp. CCI3.2]MEB0120632.1 hypothetical protein [Pseudomonas sp. CCI1.2]